jgi:hypothetical protein
MYWKFPCNNESYYDGVWNTGKICILYVKQNHNTTEISHVFYHKVQHLNYVYPRDLGKNIRMGAFVLLGVWWATGRILKSWGGDLKKLNAGCFGCSLGSPFLSEIKGFDQRFRFYSGRACLVAVIPITGPNGVPWGSDSLVSHNSSFP